jgi:hypothetical protein
MPGETEVKLDHAAHRLWWQEAISLLHTQGGSIDRPQPVASKDVVVHQGARLLGQRAAGAPEPRAAVAARAARDAELLADVATALGCDHHQNDVCGDGDETDEIIDFDCLSAGALVVGVVQGAQISRYVDFRAPSEDCHNATDDADIVEQEAKDEEEQQIFAEAAVQPTLVVEPARQQGHKLSVIQTSEGSSHHEIQARVRRRSDI